MDMHSLIQRSECVWEIEPQGRMQVPVVFYATEDLMHGMDDKVRQQATNVASLPGIVQASYVMPDAHWGYGFPIGGVAAFDEQRGGVVSAGGVGFDVWICCTTSPTTRASSKSIAWTGGCGRCTSIARAPRAPSGRGIPTCRTRCVRRASPC